MVADDLLGIFNYPTDKFLVGDPTDPMGLLYCGKTVQLFDWQLFHRSPDDLRRLAIEAGFSHNQIDIRSEELGINLFLHLQR